MKTIKQIAEEIGVSKQAIYKKIKQEPLSTSLQGLTTTNGNTVYISVDGEELIKSTFNTDKPVNQSTKLVDDITARFIDSLQGQISALTEQNQNLREQLNQERQHSREHADRITELAADLAKLANNAQHLHAGDIIPRLASGGDTTEGADQPAPEQPIAEPVTAHASGRPGAHNSDKRKPTPGAAPTRRGSAGRAGNKSQSLFSGIFKRKKEVKYATATRR